MEKYASRGDWTPSAWAVLTMAFGPTRSVSLAYTVLSDETIARERLTLPRYVRS